MTIIDYQELVASRGLRRLMGLRGSLGLMGLRGLIALIALMGLWPLSASAQIKIGGNVYGGGNHAMVKGSTSVTVKGGDIGAVLDPEATRPVENPMGRVFGGARLANVGGYSYVHIDGEHATDYIVVNQVYGGNDIAGRVGTAKAVSQPMPADSLTAIKRSGIAADADDPRRNAIDDTWNSYVRVSGKNESEAVYYTQGEIDAAAENDDAYGKTIYHVKTAAVPDADAKKIYIGQLFGGGNGEYDYVTEPAGGGKETHLVYNKTDKNHTTPLALKTTAVGGEGFTLPVTDKTYLEVLGGSIVYGYGGGNNATVQEKTVIHYDNPSKVVNHILVNSDGAEGNATVYSAYATYKDNEAEGISQPSWEEGAYAAYSDLLSDARFLEMGINTTFSQPSSDAFQVGRFFGGNNLAEMKIRPTWNLLSGKIRNLYSGGNRGAMTSPEGLLLEIMGYSSLKVDNLYGGCRMADVRPEKDGILATVLNLDGYHFPNEFSARTLVRGGDINNVYGGNDVTGIVYGGNAVGVYTSIRGDLYGGGNGAYPYTDNEQLADDRTFADFYYDRGSRTTTAALKAFRPNAEQVSIRLSGTDAKHPTVIKGSIYIGGNCASLATTKRNPKVELKIGSHVIANNVFLGNNGAGMINPDYLKLYAGGIDENGDYVASGGMPFSSMTLTEASVMANYMDAVTMTLQPSIVFDKVLNGDPADYIDYSSSIGSFYCGGNVGSMSIAGKNTYHIDRGLNIFEKFVGGCNNADVVADTYNAAFDGGVLGSTDERDSFTDADGNIKDRLEINFENLTITPKRWNDTGTELIWNTQKWGDVTPYYTAVEEGTTLFAGYTYYTSDKGAGEFTALGTEKANGTNYFIKETAGFNKVEKDPTDEDIRLLGGNIYGGCYESGHVNGNVVININADVIRKDEIFGETNSGVELENQRDDLMAVAMSVFGAGYGEDTEVWGSTTVNHNNGYAFQIYGGGEQGVVGKPRDVKDENGQVTGEEYYYDPAFSSTVNLNGATAIYSSDGTASDLAETEYIYGGGNEGDVCGNTYVNLGNGRIYDAFGGASDADIYGHTEVIIGRQPNGSGGYKLGFPWIRDIVYGGSDFGGEIHGEYEEDYDYTARIRNYATYKTQLHGYDEGKHDYLLKAASYVEYLQGRVDTIFGGSYGSYDYTNTALYGIGNKMPRQEGAFVNIRPEANDRNMVKAVFGAGTGYPANRQDDKAQDRSYVLIDIPDDESLPDKTKVRLAGMEVFGAGSYNGIGMGIPMATTFADGYDRDKVSAVIDLLHGQIGNAYGGSYNEGNTCRTVVNVPAESTIKIGNIFGGAYGTRILPPCDVIQSIVNYNNTSEKAVVTGAIYGGNNNERRTIFTNVNISSPVWSNKAKGYLAKVYGAGNGFDTWSEHTQVNLLKGAKVYEVYGGAQMGHVLNAETVQKYMQSNQAKPSINICAQAPWNDPERWVDGVVGGTVKGTYTTEWNKDWVDAWSLGDYYSPIDEEHPENNFMNYFDTFAALKATSLVRKSEIDDRDYTGYTPEEKAKRYQVYNTNVIINEGAEVVNYAYGGGYGDAGSPMSGDVWGHTYIALLGGTVKKDIYAAGTAGAVNDGFALSGPYNASSNPFGFTASTTAYIKGGTCRNVYGGGWEGNVGNHSGEISDSPVGDIVGDTHVIIGDMTGTSFINGIPAIQRNVYGGGEGGAVYGTAHVTINNGYIGYVHLNKNEAQDERGQIVTAAGTKERYDEKVIDETWKNSQTGQFEPNTNLTDAGCVFGGGYIDDSTVDKTEITINGGEVRNSVFGGGEVAAIGRGTMSKSGSTYTLTGIYRPGKTHIDMYSGHVHRNVFGGGRGFDNLGRVGSLNCPGYIFGQTEVNVHGGEIGTAAGVANGYGNVFGGCDIGRVYSAYEITPTTFGKGVKSGERYKDRYQGYYYQHAWADDGAFVTVDVPATYYTAEDDEVIAGTKNVGDVKTPAKTERQFTEDCKVVIEPMCKVNYEVTIGGTEYSAGQFVPIEKLNTLKDKNSDAAKWSCLDDAGIIIHNAVFAGGNTLPGSTTTSANTVTVYGNATASIHDVFHRDLITLGTGHTGGLYGDGNLTLVDGYRELNITNYGTDYYSIDKEITIDKYYDLPEREAAYYELKYTCLKECTDKDGTRYRPADPSNANSKASTITADDFFTLFKDIEGMIVVEDNTESPNYGNNIPNKEYWKESGVLPVYAGRLMNSIQRADFCGVFGSRMVMQGAQDRVPDEVDYTNYTINRVREVSLNKMDSKIASDLAIAKGDPEYYKKHTHGNYFGIYSIVNYLGALTSDVDFQKAIRVTDNENTETYGPDLDYTSATIDIDGTKITTTEARTALLAKAAAIDGVTVSDETITASSTEALYKLRSLSGLTITGTRLTDQTYYKWKALHHNERKRNNGNSHNKLALASGVYLEITTEESTGDGLYEKVWGPITGVVELDLINVSPGIGGGFVYAKNIHGNPSESGAVNTTLTALNRGAVTQWDYTFTDEVAGATESDPATNTQHEWETSGNFVHSTQTIIDDCYNISNRYLLDQSPMPAHYWYIKGTTYVYDQYISAYTGQSNAFSQAVEIPLTIAAASHGKMKLLNVMPNRYAYYSAPGVKLENDKKVVINDKTYYLNDPISYWDWYLLSASERDLFKEKTYTNCITCKIDGVEYAAGTYVMSDADYATYKTTFPAGKSKHEYTDADGKAIEKADKTAADDDYIFRLSNNVSHDDGYILTYEVNNPSQWNTWYTQKTAASKINTDAYGKLTAEQQKAYEDGPTYRLKDEITGGTMLGQQTYTVGDLISKNVEDTYKGVDEGNRPDASTQATFEPAYLVKENLVVTEGGVEHHYNKGVAVSQTFKLENETGSYDEAYICTKTVQISKDDVIYRDTKMTKTEWQTLYDRYKDGTEAERMIAKDLLDNVVPAYYCTVAGLYGGNYYVAGTNYRGLEAWSSMSETDRAKFDFNYDALDLLIDPSYSKTGGQEEGKKYQYDSAYGDLAGAEANAAQYSLETPVDYTATYNGSDTGTYNGVTLSHGTEYSRVDYEKLPNEQRHYAPIAVTDAGTYYIVNSPFQVGSTPYAVGSTISFDTYESLPDKSYVTGINFSEENTTFYYCRDDYEIATDGHGVTSVKGDNSNSYTAGETVPVGAIISAETFTTLDNYQKNFTIHGISPTETSTFYVSRESDIYNLSKEKIVTVIYQYDYEESDASGNVTPVSERHVLNIHLQFKSGVPIVDDIVKPDIILPGWFITMREPDVTPGAYEVTGGGWELFESLPDAERHTNGIDYEPMADPLYWYQDSFYVAYYAKSYLGRTYSNAVPVRVANYHDLADVMSEKNKTHHMYIDHTGVKRDSKIYINDYSKSSQNGLDLFKSLYDLSVASVASGSVDEETGLYTSGTFVGHKPLNSRVAGGSNLEFFLRTDIDHTKKWVTNPDYDANDPEETDPELIQIDNPWTPIASGDDPCFNGNFHGDGHTISGLAPASGTTGSLFGKLCGSVYNLGVMGSFTGAGVADYGDGYVESCWTKTSASAVGVQPDYAPLPAGLTKPYAVFGIPTDNKGYQVVNSYYYDGNKDLYTTTEGDAEISYTNGSSGNVTRKSAQAFYNGELAYDLNNFYLYKRYSDHLGLGSGVSYDYFTIGEDNKPVLHMDQYYVKNTNAKYCSSGTGSESTYTKYVEDRFADGDFRYAAGEIPETIDERHWIEDNEDGTPEIDRFSPIYPDDYIFFGQKLTYGWAAEAHQNVPTAVARDEGRLSLNDDGNRVYRAPAYYRNSNMGVTHFNPAAYLAQKEQLTDEQIAYNEEHPESAVTPRDAYPGMTAIDFAGHDDMTWGLGSVSGGLPAGGSAFYPPLLDDDGLTAIQNCDETQNLLVYAPAATTSGASASHSAYNPQTHGVLSAYFVDPDYSSHYDDSDPYRRVSENTDIVHGHLVQHNKTATNDHLLVDKEDFNAPFGYRFDADHRMWYQRKPNPTEYVDHNSGWQGISLPFTAELVTTDTKGEITHFYSGSATSANSTEKIGHEYWLREFKNITEEGTEPVVAKASFGYPTAAGATKNVTNTFLWDYYYENADLHKQKDKNDDTYLQYQQYYKSARNYSAYPLLNGATPYILGLPGQIYYEFDLSGKFVAQNTAVPIPQLAKQVITFASNKAAVIGVSDDETIGNKAGKKINNKGHDYTFRPSYMNMELEAGDYVLNSDGNAYVKLVADAATNTTNKVTTTQVAFRPYFTAATSSGSRRTADQIIFVNDDDGQMDEPLSVLDGALEIFARDHKIIVRSNKSEPTAVSIITTSGITIANFVIQPGETIETPIRFTGVYIVNKKKLLVK